MGNGPPIRTFRSYEEGRGVDEGKYIQEEIAAAVEEVQLFSVSAYLETR
jgi:hypothetical protein